MSPAPVVGVDGSPDGWLAVRYQSSTFSGVRQYSDIGALWQDNRNAAQILLDVPIGLSATRAARSPERAARSRLQGRRHSVFNVPIRGILDSGSYHDANQRQRAAIGKGLQQQTYNLLPKIREVDDLLAGDDGPGQAIVRESHPELCFWALNDENPMQYSKHGQPAAAFWERVDVLERVQPSFRDAVFTAGEAIADWDAPACSNDDLLDAFALSVTASDLTGDLQTVPEKPPRDETGLRMEMVYAEP